MQRYNRSLDFMLSAAVKLHQGKPVLAAKLLTKATKEPSFAHAVRILEASLQQGFQAQAKVIEARLKVKAAEEAEDADLEGLVGDLDDLGEEESHGGEAEGEPEEVEDEAIEEESEEESDEPFEASAKFAEILASMQKGKKQKRG
jgi:hypothetical protein